MKYTYYPGCSAHSTARDMHASSLAVARKVGVDFIEPKGWTCCGASAAHQTDKVLSIALPVANLILAQKMGMDMVVNCAACYNRMKTANHEIKGFSQMREKVKYAVGQDYDGSVRVRHFIEILLHDVGIEKLRKSFTSSLNGLKVASYYGCFLVRPHEVTTFDDPENPTSLDQLVTAMGGVSLDWPYKVECCGGGLNLTRTDLLVTFSSSIIEMAKLSGADCISVVCPMCHSSLDLRQRDINKANSKSYNMPILYITQLLGLCLGISQKKLGLERLMVNPKSIVKAIQIVT